ncbi:LacI family DNA-binding transcriptional regulator [Paenibacillus planticolens]|uniref:LacI family DNA-binding transcriptional regulator n=1 Tax=Paenibacillus planticolens TaxID=2654976 RepID=A0ABX1ZY34_9BACL|nr:LacI family DNA-binding transcriptional regulator [Paenibacillus planticolens]NOV03769.1 LacI family DNA-binding transcriptional regulator [Paenibacillus planticolens]
MKPTIYDIAKAAGVSTATVSKVLNNSGRISEKTKIKIREIMEDLRYQPNVLASAMKGKGTFQIALLIPDVENPVYAQYLKHIENRGQEQGFSVVMCCTDDNPDKEARHISLMRNKQVDGFIIASQFKNEELLKELLEDKVPIVLFAHEKQDILVDSVTVDDCFGGVIATEHLISLGHKRIGIVAEDTVSSHERIRGYKFALQKAELPYDEKFIQIGGTKMEDAEHAAGKLFSSANRATAIFGTNDLMAFGVMRAARKHQIAVPQELSIIGFDNTPMCSIVSPELTSVAMPVSDLGKKAMDLIIHKIEGNDDIKQRILLLPHLVVRDSTSAI